MRRKAHPTAKPGRGLRSASARFRSVRTIFMDCANDRLISSEVIPIRRSLSIAEPLHLRKRFNAYLDGLHHAGRGRGGGDHVLISNLEALGSPSIMKSAAAAAALIALAGCAVTMPFPPLATSSRDSHFACKVGSKCPNETRNPRVANRRSKPIDDGKIDDNPSDFIVNGRSTTE